MFMTPEELASKLNIKVGTLAVWRVRGTGPAYKKVGRAVRYDPQDIETWLNKNSRSGTGSHV